MSTSGDALYGSHYDHNSRDFVVQADENGRSFDYEYDGREQLDEVTTPEGEAVHYEYDLSGNRTTRKTTIQGAISDKHEEITIEQLMEKILLAMNGKAGEQTGGQGNGKGNAYAYGKDNGNANNNGDGNANGNGKNDKVCEAGSNKRQRRKKKRKWKWWKPRQQQRQWKRRLWCDRHRQCP